MQKCVNLRQTVLIIIQDHLVFLGCIWDGIGNGVFDIFYKKNFQESEFCAAPQMFRFHLIAVVILLQLMRLS